MQKCLYCLFFLLAFSSCAFSLAELHEVALTGLMHLLDAPACCCLSGLRNAADLFGRRKWVSHFILLPPWFCVKMAFISLGQGGGSGGKHSQIVELSWVHGETGPWHSVGLKLLAFPQTIPRYWPKKSAVTTLWWVRGFNSLYTASLCPLASLSLWMWSGCAWGDLCSEQSPAQGQPCFPVLNYVMVKKGDSLVMLFLYLLRWQHQCRRLMAGFWLLQMPDRRKLACICLRLWIDFFFFFFFKSPKGQANGYKHVLYLWDQHWDGLHVINWCWKMGGGTLEPHKMIQSLKKMLRNGRHEALCLFSLSKKTEQRIDYDGKGTSLEEKYQVLKGSLI